MIHNAITIRNRYGRSFCLAVRGGKPRPNTQSGSDSPNIRQIIRSFDLPAGFWQKYLAAFEQDLSSQNKPLWEDAICRLIQQEKLLLIPIRQEIVQSSHINLSAKDKDLRLLPSQLASDLQTQRKKSFTSAEQAAEFLSEQNLSDKKLRQLSSHLGLSANEAPAEKIADMLASGDLILIEQIKATPRATKPSTAATGTEPGSRQAGLGPSSQPSEKTSFELNLLDELGESIDGVEFTLLADGQEHVLSTSQGKIQLNNANDKFATAKLKSLDNLFENVIERWNAVREGSSPSAENMSVKKYNDIDKAVSLSGGQASTFVLAQPKGNLSLKLCEKSLSSHYKNCEYSIDGPAQFEGSTDEEGNVSHSGITPGDYTLTLKTKHFEGTPDERIDEFTTPLIVLGESAEATQERAIGSLPSIKSVAASGALFEQNKTFLLPTALASIGHARDCYIQNPQRDLLIVSHAKARESSDSSELATKRAEILKAMLEHNVDAWLNSYDGSSDSAIPKWSAREDIFMLRTMRDLRFKPKEDDIVTWFQQSRGLSVDGIAGPQTRRQLITEYFALTGKKFANVEGLEPTISIHACGENFPPAQEASTEEASTEEVSTEEPSSEQASTQETNAEKPEDQAQAEKFELSHNRAEFLFFDREFGVVPAPTGENGAEYEDWAKRAEKTHEEFIPPLRFELTHLSLKHMLYRTGSAVLLPEGEAPTDEQGTAASSVCLLATALRYFEEHPKDKILIAGHTDSQGSDKTNDKLSAQRAELCHAILTRQHQVFVDIALDTGLVSDWKQILQWASKAITLPEFSSCIPEAIDDNAQTGKQALENFQTAFNTNKASINSDVADLKVDGIMGKNTWGAIFDCYQFNIEEELGEDREAVTSMQEALSFVPTEQPFVGFGEDHPADGNEADNQQSQENRRVEVLFFAEGHEPITRIIENSPEECELYLPNIYKRTPITMSTVKRKSFELRLEASTGEMLPGIDYIVTMDDGSERRGTLDKKGTAKIKVIDGALFQVDYQDHDKIRATVFAKRLVAALDDKNVEKILPIISQPLKVVKQVKEIIDKHFDRSEKLVDEIKAVSEPTDFHEVVAYYLAGLKMDGEDKVVFPYEEPIPKEDHVPGRELDG